MKNSIIYILGATVLVGGAYLFLKNKKAKDLAELDTLGGTTPSGTTPSGTTPDGTTSPLSTATDGVAPSDANLNLANATVEAGKRAILVSTANKSCLGLYDSRIGGMMSGRPSDYNKAYDDCTFEKINAKRQLVELDKKLAGLGYKVDAIGQLVKI